ncbi:efflux transporter outer membrane subunit [Ramlibacter sp. RBP-2]|uniref:Efflux transporter outer membrane subunit n=1 Tax=Ramlibacter lithotrophicus TaxID=2606681 RepID=A0A7X6I5W7_9BURK|nr:efflux transporter outer membrane subunit [Ramlibacter lithotrophicus]NKE65620.1 efflux transporter outer membrane subunit [Ramlibacter lithotrophicus]
MHMKIPCRPAVLVLALALAGCAVGPAYQPPPVETPVAFKEGHGAWVRAVPADLLERGPWWELFQDPELNALAARVEVSNQNVAAAVARYAQARALVAEQRATLFPVVSLDGGGSRSGGGGDTPTRGSYQVDIGGAWEPDVWGRLRRGVESARSGEQASLADLQAARLSAQGELAVDYFNLRELDASIALQGQTIAGYERTLRITSNRYEAGIVARTDVLQAQTQLANARAELLGLQRQRAVLEHAIAVLAGQAPGSFSLAPRTAWQGVVPDVPFDVPSTLLQRRPDIAAAERRVAQANEQIGIAQSALYPSLRLSGSLGAGAASIGDLFSASALAWSLGASLAQSIFDAGGRQARVAGVRASHEEAAARYRQTVLAAFQDVEDQLVASRVLQQQLALRQQAADAASLVEQQVLNRYQAGQVSFTEVVTAQVTAQNARRALTQALSDRQVAAVALVQALGGGWRGL